MAGGVELDVKKHLVHIAPAPALGWVIAFDNWMTRRTKVSGCMPVWGLVAAADMAAAPAEPQMEPAPTDP
jgi:hypothetical protein